MPGPGSNDNSVATFNKSKKDDLDKINKKVHEDAVANAQAVRNAHTQEKQALIAASTKDKLAQLKRDKFTTVDGHEVTLYKALQHKVKQVIGSGQEAFNDWRSAMMSLLSLYMTLVEAIAADINAPIYKGFYGAKGQIHQLLEQGKGMIAEKLRSAHIDMPNMVHDVTMGDDNKLNIGALKDIHGHDYSQEQNPDVPGETMQHVFDKLVKLWLRTHDYVPAGNLEGHYVHNATGQPLTKADFEIMKNDPDTGLDKFFNTDNELHYSSAMRP